MREELTVGAVEVGAKADPIDGVYSLGAIESGRLNPTIEGVVHASRAMGVHLSREDAEELIDRLMHGEPTRTSC